MGYLQDLRFNIILNEYSMPYSIPVYYLDHIYVHQHASVSKPHTSVFNVKFCLSALSNVHMVCRGCSCRLILCISILPHTNRVQLIKTDNYKCSTLVKCDIGYTLSAVGTVYQDVVWQLEVLVEVSMFNPLNPTPPQLCSVF